MGDSSAVEASKHKGVGKGRYSSMLSVCDKTLTQANLVNLQLTDHTLSLREVRAGTQGRKLEAGAEAVHGGAMFTGLFPLACSATPPIQLGSPASGWQCLLQHGHLYIN